MQKIKLDITGIQYSQTQSGSYVLTLLEVGGRRKLPILIGGFEAQSIAVELEKMVPNRPLTHDLIKTFCKSFGVNVKEIIIYKFLEGVFYSKIICEKDGMLTEIDSRTSDAIAVGVRFNSPIYTYENVLEEVDSSEGAENGSEEDIFDEEEVEVTEESELKNASKEELSHRLQEAIENEAYELASKIRDELNRREK
ncbi:MAG: bifunctional nuclease domain-containing protein [Crocinitomicaceae bacterium]|jgi:bifunctional DNase/RNase